MAIPGVKVDKFEIIKALHSEKGIIKNAAASINIAAETIYNWMKKDADIANAVKEARENYDKEIIDIKCNLKKKAFKSAENLIDDDDTAMTIFLLKTLGDLREHNNVTKFIVTKVEKPFESINPDSP